MTRNGSRTRAASCVGKVRFISAYAAHLALRNVHFKGNVYRCRYCHGWHVGGTGAV